MSNPRKPYPVEVEIYGQPQAIDSRDYAIGQIILVAIYLALGPISPFKVRFPDLYLHHGLTRNETHEATDLPMVQVYRYQWIRDANGVCEAEYTVNFDVAKRIANQLDRSDLRRVAKEAAHGLVRQRTVRT